MERPPYTGIQQWTATRRATVKGSATVSSNRAASLSQTSPASESCSSASQNLRQRTASAYQHIPVQKSIIRWDSSANASETATRWYVPPQQVCKRGAKPTPVCGRYSRGLRDPPKKPRGPDTGPYRCPRCDRGYARVQSVRLHFPRCVALNGNPDCDSWVRIFWS